MAKETFDLNEQEQEALVQWWLNVCERPEVPFCTDGERELSAIEIANEIRAGTEEGKGHMRALLLLRDSDKMDLDEFVRRIGESKHSS